MTWAIRAHQVLRFYPTTPRLRIPGDVHRLFGEDSRPEPYIQEDYKRLRTTSGT